jgi:hypothetical protein
MKVCWNSSESMRRASSTLWDSNPLKLRQPPKMVSRTQLSTSKSWTRSLSQSVHPQEWQDPMRCLKEKFSVRCRNGRADADGCWGWEIRCILVLDRCSVPLNPGKDSKFDLIKLISSHANDCKWMKTTLRPERMIDWMARAVSAAPWLPLLKECNSLINLITAAMKKIWTTCSVFPEFIPFSSPLWELVLWVLRVANAHQLQCWTTLP